MLPVIQLGPLSLPTPGLVLLLGLWTGLVLAEKTASRFNVTPGEVYNGVLLGLVSGIIGGRLLFVGQNLEAFTQNWRDLISLNPQLIDAAGGIFIAVVAMLIYAQKRNLPMGSFCAALMPVPAVLAVALPLADYLGGYRLGTATQMPWGIDLFGLSRHPVQIYEVLVQLSILIGILGISFYHKEKSQKVVIWGFIALTSATRLVFEAFYVGGTLVGDHIRLNQIIAWVFLAVALFTLGHPSNVVKTMGHESIEETHNESLFGRPE